MAKQHVPPELYLNRELGQLEFNRRVLALAEDRARSLHLREIRLYTNQAMTENLSYYPRYGYTETHRAEQDGFHRVYFHKRLD